MSMRGRKAHPLLEAISMLGQTPNKNSSCFIGQCRYTCKKQLHVNPILRTHDFSYYLENKLQYKGSQICLLSPAALTAKLNICSETCFIALLLGEPARATAFRVGYIASNLSVAYTKHHS